MKRTPQGAREIRTFSLKVNGRQRDDWVATARALEISPHRLAHRALLGAVGPPSSLVIVSDDRAYLCRVEVEAGAVRVVEPRTGARVLEAPDWAAVLKHFRGLPVELYLPIGGPVRVL